MQGRAQEGAKVAWATARLPIWTEVAPPKEIYKKKMLIVLRHANSGQKKKRVKQKGKAGRGRGQSGVVFSTASQSEEPKSRAEEGRHGDELNYYGYSHLVDVCVRVHVRVFVARDRQSEEPKSRAEEGRHGDELNYYGYSHLVDVCVRVYVRVCVCVS